MARIRLKITQQDFQHLQDLVFADLPREAGAFALAGVSRTDTGMDILVRRHVEIPQELFRLQTEVRLEVEPRAVNGMISLCASNQLGVVMCHSHSSNSPYSPSDDYGEKRLFDTLREFIPEQAPTASLLFYPGGVRGRVWLPNQAAPLPIDEIIVLGCSIHRYTNRQSHTFQASEQFDRQVRAFGSHGQYLIEHSHVAIVGVGGTGSSVAEQLTRLGVNDMLLVDPDDFEASNLTRMYGTFADPSDTHWWQFWKRKPVSQKKVGLVAAHLRRINQNLRVQTVAQSIVQDSAAKMLCDRDVIFLCTDEHWGRSVVNQIAYQYMIPTINLGMAITAHKSNIESGVGTVDVLFPDKACLWCKQFLNSKRISAESMPSADRASRLEEGYVQNIDTKQPSVISINTTVAGMAVTQFLQLLTGFQGDFGDVERLNYNVLEGRVTRGKTQIDDGCVCKKVRAKGDLHHLNTI
jgi:molybdopterin/thiamine biosynthesis adenylyltransferase